MFPGLHIVFFSAIFSYLLFTMVFYAFSHPFQVLFLIGTVDVFLDASEVTVQLLFLAIEFVVKMV